MNKVLSKNCLRAISKLNIGHHAEGISWKNVYNNQKGGTCEDIAAIAKLAGYEFFIWSDRLWSTELLIRIDFDITELG
jgi:hypothetical protein